MNGSSGKFNFTGRVKSFEFAFKGLWFVLACQDSSRLHLAPGKRFEYNGIDRTSWRKADR